VRIRSAPLVALVLALAGAVPASATTASQAIDFLNQQRAANQIPGTITQDPYYTTGCKNHNNYMAQNGGLQHGEQPGNPGYTAEGSDYNNIGEVLAQGGSGWSASTNPWDAAPLHQTILFDPKISTAGYDETDPFFCMRLHSEFVQRPAPTLYAYTSNKGRTEVPTSIIVNGEGPYAPQEAVGIPQGVATGPQILFFTDQFGAANHATSFSLKGPGGGEVEAKMVDSTTPPPNGNDYKPFNAGGDLIPVHPLDPFTTYDVSVIWHDDNTGVDTPQTLSFKTAGFQRGLTLKLSKKLARGRKATLSAPGEATGQKATVKIAVQRKGKKKAKTVSTKTISLKTSQRIKTPRKPKGGHVIVTVSVKKFTLGDTQFTVKSATRRY
jgi:hypothetical protein